MAYQLNITGNTLSKLIDSYYHPPHQDVVDGLHTVSSPQSITGGAETTFTNNGSVRNYSALPDHITNIWNTSTNVAAFSEEMNEPIYVARLELTIDPATVGNFDFKMYVNDSSPKLIQTVTVPYKNAIGRISAIFTFYLGTETGYDVKNDGVYFTITPSGNADIYDKTILLYRT